MVLSPTRSVRKGDKFPISIRDGSAEVKIYHTPTKVKGKDYDQFTVAYYLGNERVRRRFSDLDQARTEAQAAVVKLANAEHESLKLTPADRAVYVQCLDLVRDLGKPLNLAVAEYADACRRLPAGVSLAAAVDDYVRRRGAVSGDTAVEQLVAEFIAAKAKAGMSERHLKDLRFRLGRFAQAFQCPVGSITTALFERFLDTLGVSARSRVNEITCIGSFIRYCVKLRKAPRDLLDEIAAVQRPKAEPPATLTWTSAEFRELLEHAPAEFVPFLVLAGFCGMRTSEVTRADWSHVTPDGNHLAVITRKGRTPSRRLVPLCAAAKAWLAPHWRAAGPICPTDREDIITRRILAPVNAARVLRGEANPLRWRENGLRHSFGTFRVALTGDIPRVSLEMGNSPQMIVKHYLQLATREQAEAWFNLLPPAPADNVIPLPVKAA